MARFRYRMQNILDIKLKLEEQAKNEYSIANAKYMDEYRKLQKMMARRKDYEERLKELLSGNLDMVKVTNARKDLNNMKTLVRRQMMEVHKAEIALEQAQKALNDIMIERKTHEKLKEKAFEDFQKELQAGELKEIDELVSFTFSNNM